MALSSTERSRRHRARKRNGRQKAAVASPPCTCGEISLFAKAEAALLAGELAPDEVWLLSRRLLHLAELHWGADADRRRRRKRRLA